MDCKSICRQCKPLQQCKPCQHSKSCQQCKPCQQCKLCQQCQQCKQCVAWCYLHFWWDFCDNSKFNSLNCQKDWEKQIFCNGFEHFIYFPNFVTFHSILLSTISTWNGECICRDKTLSIALLQQFRAKFVSSYFSPDQFASFGLGMIKTLQIQCKRHHNYWYWPLCLR